MLWILISIMIIMLQKAEVEWLSYERMPGDTFVPANPNTHYKEE